MKHTKVFRIRPDGTEFLQDVINAGSKFRNQKVPGNEAMQEFPAQRAVAERLIMGWNWNGSFPTGTRWRIQQFNRSLQ